jgi:predicted TIM-barrel fold metal-dependent hydrolase
MPDSETTRYESWDKQRYLTELAMLRNPLKIIPMFHFDPRRWQIQDGGIMEPLEKVRNGLYLGFKMYTAQGYRPWDVRRLPILKKFYSACASAGIPVMNHCTPEGACSFDKKAFRKFSHPSDSKEDKARQNEYWINTNYFDDDFVAPNAWKEVLDNNRNLRLCLAHFGGNTSKGREWSMQIIELMKNYTYVYTDISSSFDNGDFRNYFRDTICTDGAFKDKIRDRIMFGTDWYMTVMDHVEYMEYCEKAKEFLDKIDTSLWLRFTQDNPYRFYRLDTARISEIAENIINLRLKDKKIKDALGPLDPKDAEEFRREAAYIRKANEPYTIYRKTFKV